jgi:hypothetical protein
MPNSGRHFVVFGLVIAWFSLAPASGVAAFAGETTAMGKDTVTVSVEGATYKVTADGAVMDARGRAVQNTDLAGKARYIANVVRGRISDSEYNGVFFSPITKTMIELQSLVKPVSGVYAYVLFSGTGIASSLVEGGLFGGPAGAFGNVLKDVVKDAVLEVVKEIVEHPEETAMKMADEAWAVGMRAYEDNYRTYHSVIEQHHVLSYDEALDFMANERQKELLGAAAQLIRDITSKKYKVGPYEDDSEANRQAKENLLTEIADMENDQLAEKAELALFMTRLKPVFEEALAGLDEYKPYSDYKERVLSLNDALAKIDRSYRSDQDLSDLKSPEGKEGIEIAREISEMTDHPVAKSLQRIDRLRDELGYYRKDVDKLAESSAISKRERSLQRLGENYRPGGRRTASHDATVGSTAEALLRRQRLQSMDWSWLHGLINDGIQLINEGIHLGSQIAQAGDPSAYQGQIDDWSIRVDQYLGRGAKELEAHAGELQELRSLRQ